MAHFFSDFQTYYADIDYTEESSAKALLSYCEETSLRHCESVGCGLVMLAEQQRAWFQLNTLFFYVMPPIFRQKFRIETWITALNGSKIQCGRDDHVFDEQGATIAYRKTWWVYVNLANRKPIPMPVEVYSKFPLSKPELDLPFTKFSPTFARPKEHQKFPILRDHIDTNSHVNNINYWIWANESLPFEEVQNWRPLVIESVFKKEMTYQDKAILAAYNRLDALPYQPFKGYEALFKTTKSFEHFLFNQKQEVVARFYSVWIPLD